jgi:hypothetical protein
MPLRLRPTLVEIPACYRRAAVSMIDSGDGRLMLQFDPCHHHHQ